MADNESAPHAVPGSAPRCVRSLRSGWVPGNRGPYQRGAGVVQLRKLEMLIEEETNEVLLVVTCSESISCGSLTTAQTEQIIHISSAVRASPVRYPLAAGKKQRFAL